MKKEIVFTDVTEKVPEAFYPKPAKHFIPDWIKNLEPYYNNGKGQTAKRCLPLLDAVMLGYTLVLDSDIRITQTNEGSYYEWSNGLGIMFHNPEQAHTHKRTGKELPKWISPWSIQTPRGYSTLFTTPLNHDRLPFQPFSAVVETDSYIAPVGIPFLLSSPKFEGTVEAGTPIAQVFPFARESWAMRVETGTTRAIDQVDQTISSKFRNGYRNFFRSGNNFS